jgi:hypothetical protein
MPNITALMISVITGDIINSRRSTTKTWLKVLKKELNKLGDTPRQWEIYRGDSFQVEVKDPADALAAAVQIKAAIKSLKGVDVRVAIGIGEKDHSEKRVTESNGSAFVHSGELDEELKSRKMSMAVRSMNKKFDDEINLYLQLTLIIMDGWTTNAAETMHAAMEQPDKSQKALGKLLSIKQNAVSTRLKRACYYEIMEVIKMYRTKVAELK